MRSGSSLNVSFQTRVMTSILGGAGTVVASYLARARGSNEPELSIGRVKDLQRFIRECEAFVEDHGHEHGDEFNPRVEQLREDFEHLLGNGNGFVMFRFIHAEMTLTGVLHRERKLSNVPNV